VKTNLPPISTRPTPPHLAKPTTTAPTPRSDDPLGALTPVLGSPNDGAGLNLPYAGPERQLGVGDTFGELSFFTEIPQMTTVR